MLMDIDFFKKYNDTYGHIAGDACLQAISHTLSRNLNRSIDFVARYGGEEFIFLLPNTDLAGAKKVANAIIRQIAILQIEHKTSEVASYVTLSIGITMFAPLDKRTTQRLLEDADHALYEAKSSGRNCWSVYKSEMDNNKK
jgi:diguanylate cyclase (GGDEF)-like protein